MLPSQTTIDKILSYIFSGGMTGVAAVLLVFLGCLIYERNRLLKELDEKDDKIDEIISDYYKGTVTISEAFNSLKLVLVEMKSKLGE